MAASDSDTQRYTGKPTGRLGAYEVSKEVPGKVLGPGELRLRKVKNHKDIGTAPCAVLVAEPLPAKSIKAKQQQQLFWPCTFVTVQDKKINIWSHGYRAVNIVNALTGEVSIYKVVGPMPADWLAYSGLRNDMAHRLCDAAERGQLFDVKELCDAFVPPMDILSTHKLPIYAYLVENRRTLHNVLIGHMGRTNALAASLALSHVFKQLGANECSYRFVPEDAPGEDQINGQPYIAKEAKVLLKQLVKLKEAGSKFDAYATKRAAILAMRHAAAECAAEPDAEDLVATTMPQPNLQPSKAAQAAAAAAAAAGETGTTPAPAAKSPQPPSNMGLNNPPTWLDLALSVAAKTPHGRIETAGRRPPAAAAGGAAGGCLPQPVELHHVPALGLAGLGGQAGFVTQGSSAAGSSHMQPLVAEGARADAEGAGAATAPAGGSSQPRGTVTLEHLSQLVEGLADRRDSALDSPTSPQQQPVAHAPAAASSLPAAAHLTEAGAAQQGNTATCTAEQAAGRSAVIAELLAVLQGSGTTHRPPQGMLAHAAGSSSTAHHTAVSNTPVGPPAGWAKGRRVLDLSGDYTPSDEANEHAVGRVPSSNTAQGGRTGVCAGSPMPYNMPAGLVNQQGGTVPQPVLLLGPGTAVEDQGGRSGDVYSVPMIMVKVEEGVPLPPHPIMVPAPGAVLVPPQPVMSHAAAAAALHPAAIASFLAGFLGHMQQHTVEGIPVVNQPPSTDAALPTMPGGPQSQAASHTNKRHRLSLSSSTSTPQGNVTAGSAAGTNHLDLQQALLGKRQRTTGDAEPVDADYSAGR